MTDRKPAMVVRHLGPRAEGEPLEFELTPKRGSRGATLRWWLRPAPFGQPPAITEVRVEATGNGTLTDADLAGITVRRLVRLSETAAGMGKADVQRLGRPPKVDRTMAERITMIAEANPRRPRAAVAEEFGRSDRQASTYLAHVRATYPDLRRRLEALS